MPESSLSNIFKEYDPRVQHVIREVLRIEQEYITDPLRTNSAALKDIRQRINRIIEEVCKGEA